MTARRGAGAAMQCEVLLIAQAFLGKAGRLSCCPEGSARRRLNNNVVATDQTLEAWSATEVARESRRACPREDSCR